MTADRSMRAAFDTGTCRAIAIAVASALAQGIVVAILLSWVPL